jgi:cysteine synthase A
MPNIKSILDLIGNTPMLKLSRLVSEGSAEVWVKLEVFNTGGSVKDGIILLQGDQRERTREILSQMGYSDRRIEVQ